jgi:hypothetical protein
MTNRIRRKTVYKIILILLVVITNGLLHASAHSLNNKSLDTENYRLCSVITASYEEKVFLGANIDAPPQDFSRFTPYIFFFPSESKENESDPEYGLIAFELFCEEKGNEHVSLLGGMNEKGLAFGSSYLPEILLNPHLEKLYSNSSENFYLKVMRECSSVACVIEMFENVDLESIKGQYHFADKTGNAVVISAGKNGELAFTKKDEGNGYLVSTNFNLANPDHGRYPCWRYDTATHMLEEKHTFTLDYFISILDAVHVEGKSTNTIFSYVFDLRTGDVYIYFFHQFEEVYKTNVPNELAHSYYGNYGVPSPDLFSQETKDLSLSEFQTYREHFFIEVAVRIGAGIGGLVLGIYLYDRIVKKRRSKLKKEE